MFLSVGALKKTHKRVDYLIREFSSWRKSQPRKALLFIAGARETETDEILRLRAELDPEAVHTLENVSRDRIATLLQAADIFTLASLHEMMPIAVLEALSSGLPIACNDDPTLRWMVGDAGRPSNISQPAALSKQFEMLADANVRLQMSGAARKRAESVFSEQTVINEVLQMYRVVAAN